MDVNKIQILAYALVAFRSSSYMVSSSISFYSVLLWFPSQISCIPIINFIKHVFKSG